MKISKQAESPAVDVDMTPMIDVVFQLLIFFTMVSVFDEAERASKVVLPKAWATVIEDMAKERMTVNIEQDGRIVVFGQGLDVDGLRRVLRGRRRLLAAYEKSTGSAPIIVRGHEDCEYRHIKDVLDAIRDEKFQKIMFASHMMEEEGR